MNRQVGDVLVERAQHLSVRIGFMRTHETTPLERFREAVLMALPDGVNSDPLPKRGEFDVPRVLGGDYFFC